VLIFCPSRDWCENLAQKIAKDVMVVGSAKESAFDALPFLKAARHGLRTCLDGSSLERLIEELKDSNAGLDPVLRRTISSGVAFHHAGEPSTPRLTF
jgi:DNA polymerase theta